MLRAAPVAACLAALLSLAACGKAKPSAAPAASRDSALQDAATLLEAAPAEDPRAAELWTRALDGDADNLARLAAYVGSDALIEASPIPLRRMTALRSLAFSDDFTALPFLAKVAAQGAEGDATAALESVSALASGARRATDPEDAPEIHDGCIALLVLAKDVTRPKERRVRAVSALRLLASRGWVPLSEVPTDVDAQ